MTDGQAWPRICVVTPSYNQAQYLEATICSILYQEYPNLEFIIMDGGSSDGSLEIIKKYEPWLTYWQSEPDEGQYQAIRAGFAHSNSQILTWLNSDDLFFPWTLRTVAEIFAQLSDVKWLSSSVSVNVDETGANIGFWFRGGLNRRWFFEDRPLAEKHFIQQEGTFWSRDLWEQTGKNFDSTLHDAGDFELWARFWQYADLVTTATPLGIFRRHARQKTSQHQLYFKEAEKVLARYPSYRPIPANILRRLVNFLHHLNPDRNWFQLQCLHPVYEMRDSKWHLVKSYEL